jgi:hypothetical protein
MPDELEDEASSMGLYDEWYPDGEALDELLDEIAEFVPDAPDAGRELAEHVITRTERLLNCENCYGGPLGALGKSTLRAAAPTVGIWYLSTLIGTMYPWR